MTEAAEVDAAQGASARTGGRKAVAFVTVISLLNSVAGMMVLPVLPSLVQGFTGTTSGAALYVGWFTVAFSLVQFVASPVLGSLSDAYGRRAVILISAFGMAADYLFMALAPGVGWLFVGRMIAGLTAASQPAINAYIADSIRPQERAGVFGWTGAAMSIGFLIGPAIGGVLGAIHPRLPFWAAAGICVAVALYGLFVLPESLPKSRRTPFNPRLANPWGSILFLKGRPEVIAVVAVFMMMMIAGQCMPTTLALYAGHRYHWSVRAVGLYLSYAGVGHLIVQSLVVKRAVKGLGERGAAVAGYSLSCIGFLIFATVSKGALFLIGTPFYNTVGLVGPAVQSQMTRKVAPTEQGRLQGAVAGLQSLTGMFAALMFTSVFSFVAARGHETWPQGLHLYLASAVLSAGAALALRFMR
jgi:DHA1 family tetracycline resistance protein-like MFS transporter